jgi:hypothetical protein
VGEAAEADGSNTRSREEQQKDRSNRQGELLGGLQAGWVSCRGRYCEMPVKTMPIFGGQKSLANRYWLDERTPLALVACTPGRVCDLVLSEEKFVLRNVQYFVLDEGDRMLDLGFRDSMLSLHEQIRPDKQTLFFSTRPEPHLGIDPTCLAHCTDKLLLTPESGRRRSAARSLPT